MRLSLCCCCLMLLLVAGIRGQEDFNLEDVFDDAKPTTKPEPQPGGNTVRSVTEAPKKPTPKPQPDGVEDDGFNLGDALGGDDPTNKPPMKPQPDQGGGEGGLDFGDRDLGDGGFADPHGQDDRPSGHDNKPHGGAEQGQEGNQSVLAGVVSAVAVAAVGAVSSFIAYQKKKLCFKGASEDPENVNMESHKGDQDPQAQSNLLAK